MALPHCRECRLKSPEKAGDGNRAFRLIAAGGFCSLRRRTFVIADASLAQAWRALRPREREVLALALVEDLPVAEISIALAIQPKCCQYPVAPGKEKADRPSARGDR